MTLLLSVAGLEGQADRPFAWNVTASAGAALLTVPSCLDGAVTRTLAPSGAIDADQPGCHVTADGSMRLTEEGSSGLVSGYPLLVPNSSSSGYSLLSSLNGGSVLRLPMVVSAASVRETSPLEPYVQSLTVRIAQQGFLLVESFRIKVAVTAATVASQSTFHPSASAAPPQPPVASGRYRLPPARVGRVEGFFVQLRDADGLAVVRESYLGVQRGELLRVGAAAAPPPPPRHGRCDWTEGGQLHVCTRRCPFTR